MKPKSKLLDDDSDSDSDLLLADIGLSKRRGTATASSSTSSATNIQLLLASCNADHERDKARDAKMRELRAQEKAIQLQEQVRKEQQQTLCLESSYSSRTNLQDLISGASGLYRDAKDISFGGGSAKNSKAFIKARNTAIASSGCHFFLAGRPHLLRYACNLFYESFDDAFHDLQQILKPHLNPQQRLNLANLERNSIGIERIRNALNKIEVDPDWLYRVAMSGSGRDGCHLLEMLSKVALDVLLCRRDSGRDHDGMSLGKFRASLECWSSATADFSTTTSRVATHADVNELGLKHLLMYWNDRCIIEAATSSADDDTTTSMETVSALVVHLSRILLDSSVKHLHIHVQQCIGNLLSYLRFAEDQAFAKQTAKLVMDPQQISSLVGPPDDDKYDDDERGSLAVSCLVEKLLAVEANNNSNNNKTLQWFQLECAIQAFEFFEIDKVRDLPDLPPPRLPPSIPTTTTTERDLELEIARQALVTTVHVFESVPKDKKQGGPHCLAIVYAALALCTTGLTWLQHVISAKDAASLTLDEGKEGDRNGSNEVGSNNEQQAKSMLVVLKQLSEAQPRVSKFVGAKFANEHFRCADETLAHFDYYFRRVAYPICAKQAGEEENVYSHKNLVQKSVREYFQFGSP